MTTAANVDDDRRRDLGRTPAFTLDGALVWGFTAIVFSRMPDELGWAEPWDRKRLVVP